MRFPTPSVGKRLAFGFTAVAALALCIAVLSLAELGGLGRQLERIVEVNNPKSDLANQMLDEINTMSVHVRTIALLSLPKAIDEELAVVEAAIDRYGKAEHALAESLAADGQPNAQEAELLKAIGAAAKQTLPHIRTAAQQGQDGASVEATMTLMLRARPVENTWRKLVRDLVRLETSYNRAALERSSADRARAMLWISGLAFASLLACGVLAWRLTRSVTRPLASAIALAERVAAGDLASSVELRSTDEFGRLMTSLERMQQSLARMVSQVRDSSESIAGASVQIAGGNRHLSQRTEQATNNLHLTAASMQQLTGIARDSADAARNANRLASSAAEVAARGGNVVSRVVATMDEIDNRSKKIADIVGVIDGIAFQTNILALNAAVEAARAGEQGRGFAVVAGEVRGLAQRSAAAAKELKGLIGNSVDQVALGASLVRDAGRTMTEIVASVQRVGEIIGQISAASAEQSAGIGQVNLAVDALDQATRQNAQLVQQSAGAAASLSDQVQRLTQAVQGFRLAEGPVFS